MAALLSSRLRFRTGLERALRDREARVRLLADNIADIVIVMDRKGYLRYVSPLVTVVGKTETDFLGRLCLDVVHEDKGLGGKPGVEGRDRFSFRFAFACGAATA